MSRPFRLLKRTPAQSRAPPPPMARPLPPPLSPQVASAPGRRSRVASLVFAKTEAEQCVLLADCPSGLLLLVSSSGAGGPCEHLQTCALQGIFPTSWFLRLIRVRMEGWPHLTSSDETMSCCFGGIVHSFLMFYTGGISLHVQLCYLQSDQTSSSESKAISCPVRREGSFNLQVLFMPLVSYLSRV